MGRSSEAGQLVVETAILALLFVALTLLAMTIAETNEGTRAKYRFGQRKDFR